MMRALPLRQHLLQKESLFDGLAQSSLLPVFVLQRVVPECFLQQYE